MSTFTHPLQRIISGKDHTLALFNLSFLERIITDALEDHEGTVSVGGRTITTYALEDHEGTVSIGDRTISNLLFAYHIDGLSGEV